MILTIICAVVIFSVIIFVHELGHFITAKAFGVNVLEFSLGMGPAIFKKQGKNTLYSLRAIPIGGFCKMEGENEDTKTEGCFSTKKPLPKIIILAAGAGMNVLLGFIIVTVLTTVGGVTRGYMPSVRVGEVMPESSVVNLIRTGDEITMVNGTRVNIQKDISFALSEYTGGECDIEFKRDGEKISGKFTPMEVEYGYIIGFNIDLDDVTPWTVLKESFFQTIWMIKLVFVSLGMLFGGKAAITDMSGPVGVVSAMNQVAQSGWYNFLFFGAFLAVNIGIMNLLPIPALDGGRIVFSLYELIFRKPVPAEKEGFVHAIGFVLLIALMIFVTWNDIMKLIG